MISTYTSSVERGILTSTYKREIKENVTESKSASISKLENFSLYTAVTSTDLLGGFDFSPDQFVTIRFGVLFVVTNLFHSATASSVGFLGTSFSMWLLLSILLDNITCTPSNDSLEGELETAFLIVMY